MGVRVKQPGPKIIEREGRGTRRRIGGSSRQVPTATSITKIRLHDISLLHPLLHEKSSYDVTLSIVMGTYNRLPLLRRCIESIRVAKGDHDIEIIVCDGGSSDGTIEWISEQSDIKLVRGALDGAVRAFNAAARLARGRFVMALNDDANLDALAIDRALSYFADPMVGQVALNFHEGGNWKFQHVHGRVYANFAVTRASIVEAVTRLTGGMWASCYYTYGGDTELSCWVYRLGYKVAAAADARLWHDEHADSLRGRNARMDRKRRLFWHRWPTQENLAFRGPLPNIEPREKALLGQIEVGEAPSQRWDRIPLADPKPGVLPPRRVVRPERVLHWQLWTREDPQTSMAAALAGMGVAGHACIQWTNLPAAERGRAFVEACRQLKPTLAFLQLQARDAIPVEALRAVRAAKEHDPALVIAVWSGDIGPGKGPWRGSSDEWQFQIANEVDLMLFTGTGQVRLLRERGMRNAAYLQIGYDTDRYFEGDDAEYGRQHSVVFMGQNYGRQFDAVPDSEAQLRRDAVVALRAVEGFAAYGAGFGSPMSQADTGPTYRRSAMAMSISLTSRLERYTSDRMLRAMACGCPTLVRSFEDMEGLGLVHAENCLKWDSTAELVELARSWTKPHRRDDLRSIGRAGAKLMRDHHRWTVRMEELSAILSTVRGDP